MDFICYTTPARTLLLAVGLGRRFLNRRGRAVANSLGVTVNVRARVSSLGMRTHRERVMQGSGSKTTLHECTAQAAHNSTHTNTWKRVTANSAHTHSQTCHQRRSRCKHPVPRFEARCPTLDTRAWTRLLSGRWTSTFRRCQSYKIAGKIEKKKHVKLDDKANTWSVELSPKRVVSSCAVERPQTRKQTITGLPSGVG